MIPKVYIDTNVFIAAFETTGVPANYAWPVLNEVEAGRIKGVTSELTLAELLSKPPKDARELMATYQSILSGGPALSVVPVTRSILIGAAGIRRESPSVRLPDAIHLATALDSDYTHFISEDRRLPRDYAFKLVPLGPHSLNAIGSRP